MAYNTKPIVTDKDGNPISQYYNPETDQYEPVEGANGANKVLVVNNDLSLIPILEKLSQLTGSVIDEEIRKSNEQTRQSNEQLRIQLYNDLLTELERIEQIDKQVPETVLEAINALRDNLAEHKAETVHQEGGVHGLVYEEGEWTPYYDSITGQFEKIDYAQQYGYYLRIGNKVFISMRIATADVALGTASNTLQIKGLPFVPKTNTYIGLSLEFIERFANEKSINNIGLANNFIYLANRTTTRTNMLTANDLKEGEDSHQNRIGLSGTYII